MTTISFKELARWSVRYTLVQCLFFYAVCFKYAYSLFPLELPFMQAHDRHIIMWYIGITYISYFAFLATVWILLPCLIAALIFKRPAIVIPVGWLVAFASICFFLLDGQLYSLYRTHVNSTYLDMAFSGHADDLFNLSGREWAVLVFGALGVALLQAALARMVWRWNKNPMSTWPWLLCLVALLQISYAILFQSMSKRRNEVVIQTKAFPYYQRVIGMWMPAKWATVSLKYWGAGYFTQAKQIDAPVSYPQHPLRCTAHKKPLNVLIVVLDTWRPDSFTPQLMPYTHGLLKHAINFQDHQSGGNGTQPGMFSLYYSIPSSYFEAMLAHKKPPIILEEARAAGYDTGVFVSASSKMPNFRDTIYLDVNTRYDSPGSKDAALRDFNVSKNIQQWMAKKRDKPFIGLAFYDIAHAYCETPFIKTPYKDAIPVCNRLSWNRYTDPVPYLHRYYNMVHHADMQIGDLMTDLKRQGLDKNTVVVITGDHGQEFNDNKRNQWEHANNFSKYQVKVPFLVLWPGKKPQTITYRTSHYDLAPTLLQEIFSCNNPPADYSIGMNLFDPTPRDKLFIGSYINNAIIQPEKITILWADGEVEVQSPDTKPLTAEKPNVTLISWALNEMRRFYRH